MGTASVAGLMVPALGSPSNYGQPVSIKSTYSCPALQVVTSDGSSFSSSSSSSSLLLVGVAHILQKPSSQTQISLRGYGSSDFFAGGGLTSSREDDVSTSGRTLGNVLVRTIRIGSSNRLQSKRTSKSNAGPDVLPSLNPNEAEKAGPFVAPEQILEAPSPYPEGNEDENPDLDVTEAEGGAEEGTENENSLRSMEEVEERLAALASQKSNKRAEEVVVSLGEDPSLPTMEDIIATAAQEGVKLQVLTFGPTFQIVVSNLDETHVFGKADGWITRWWPKGKILHLEAIRLERGSSKDVGNVGGAGFFVGAATLRYGFDQGCRTAELLAIYDDKVTHSKLVKYYSRFGFKRMYEVNDEELKFYLDRIVWGGVGTRMDADCEELLRRWCAVLKPKTRSLSRRRN
ncbi:unnamed protein product [Calypogeia fissa]